MPNDETLQGLEIYKTLFKQECCAWHAYFGKSKIILLN